MYNTELQKRLEKHLKEKGISQSKAAPLIGISTSALSQYLKSKYEGGNIENVENKIMIWLEHEEHMDERTEKTAAYKPVVNDYLETSISSDIYKRIRYCSIEKGMVILHGDAGIGKTKAAEKYAKDNYTTTIYVQVTPSSGSLGNSLKIIAEALKVTESTNRYITSSRIKNALVNTNKTLIIDEAQHLKMLALEEIRNLSDPDDLLGLPGSGIVLIGNTEIYNKMLGHKSASFAQLFSRIKMHKYYQTSNVLKSDIEIIFPYLKENKMDKEIEFLWGISRSKWGIRGAVNVYNNAVNNEDVSFKGLYDMASDMGVGVV